MKERKKTEIECIMCGKVFIAKTTVACCCSDECKKKRKAQLDHARIAKFRKPKKTPAPRVTIDKTLKECREKNISYADRQIQETLQMVGGIKL